MSPLCSRVVSPVPHDGSYRLGLHVWSCCKLLHSSDILEKNTVEIEVVTTMPCTVLVRVVQNLEEVYITSSTIGPRLLNPSNYKTDYSIPCIFQNQPNNPLRWFWRVVLSFSFLFIAAESLKNYNKSNKNSKIEIKFCWPLHE